MTETIIVNELGCHRYDGDGREVIQVFEGSGEPLFADRYKQPMADTEFLFDLLEKNEGLGMHRYLIKFYYRSIERQEAGQAACNVTEIRNCIRERYRDKMHDCRIAAMVADQSWKVATGG